MAGINEAVVEEIKSRIDLVDLIASYGIQVKTAGATKKACCPFHHEKTPSFNINENKGFYHCFGCGESGDAIKFVMKMDGLTFIEAVKKLAQQCGVTIEEKVDPAAVKRKRLYALLAELAAFYRRCLKTTKEAEPAREYLAKRDLGEEIQEAWTIGYAPAGIANDRKWAEKHGFSDDELAAAGVIKAPDRAGDLGYHRFGGRLMFTIRDKSGRVVGFSGRQLVASKNSGKYVNSPETEVFSKKRILFGFDKAARAIAATDNPHHEVIVCEGQIDCIRLHAAGFANAVASQGTAFTEEHMKMLRRVSDAAVLVFDDDNAGHKAAIRSAAMLLAYEMPVRVVSLPGGDDPDSFLRKNPPEAFRNLIDNPESIVSFQCRVERAKEAKPDSVDAMNRIVKAMLGTIAQSKNAVLKAMMIAEASKLLKVPELALDEELAKIKVEEAAPDPTSEGEMPEETPNEAAEDASQVAEIAAIDAAKTLPPPPREMALMEFLMANEYSEEVKTIDAMLGEYLPRETIVNDFTWGFIEGWRAGVSTGEDTLAPWLDAREGEERLWADRLLIDQRRAQACTLKPTEILQDYIRDFWVETLKRRRGDLPAVGDAEADLKRLKLTMDIKRFKSVRWHQVKELIASYLH